MFLDYVNGRGTGQGASALGTVVCVVNEPIAEGRVLVVRVATSTTEYPSSGETSLHSSVSDGLGNVYAKAGEVTMQGASEFEKTVTVSLWLCHVTTALPDETSVTATFNNTTYIGRNIAVAEYEMDHPGALVEVEEIGVAFDASSGADTMSVTCTPPASDEYTWLLAGAHNARDDVGIGLDAQYSSDLVKHMADNGFFGSTTMWGQYRQLQVETQTWDGTLSTSVRWALLLVAVKATPPPPPAPEAGTREFQPDFETDTHAVDNTTTNARPDAIVTDYRVVEIMGPKEVDDVSDGHDTWAWRFRAEPGAVYFARRLTIDGPEYREEELLMEYTGAEITEIDAAFSETGTVFFCSGRATGGGGSDEVHIYWYDDDEEVEDYVWQNIGAGRSPRCVLDYFVTTVGPHVCPPETDIQLFYMKPGQTHAVRREQSSRYATDIPIPVLSYNSRRRIHRAIRTQDRRISLYGTDRNIVTGRYAEWRVDSVVYKDALLGRPTFLNWSSATLDIMQDGHSMWHAPGSTEETWFLRVQTPDALIAADGDAIEVQASDQFPSGANPSFPEQNQESSVDIGAGGYQDFSFEMEYGAGLVNLVAFRARTRKLITGITCYSPWRYTVIPAAYPVTTGHEDILVNCDADVIIDVSTRMAFWLRAGLVEATYIQGGPHHCEDDPPVSSAPYPDIFVGAAPNTTPSYPFPLYLRSWQARRRAYENINFTDLDGHYLGTVIGAVLESSAETPAGMAPKEYDWDSSGFPRQFPDDGGMWPVPPVSNDVVAS